MSLGKKLANYRKLAGLTQQQLGEELNLSPQAISKWENDLAEPDLATLRALSNLYKVPIGEMIDPNIGVTEPPAEEPQPDKDTEPKLEVIGFCKNCGITVSEETVGEKTPVILCKRCCEKRDADARAAELNAKLEKEKKKNAIKYEHVGKLKLSLIVAGIAALIYAITMIVVTIKTEDATLIPLDFFGIYMVFAFVACLFYDCVVSDILFHWVGKSFNWPGLIFTFDIDGIIWLIGMKLLFWILGLLLGFLCAIIGVVLGFICAPFVFPFIMISMRKAIVSGTESDYMIVSGTKSDYI